MKKCITGMLLCFLVLIGIGMMKPVTVHAASSGTYDGVSWQITDDGELILGEAGTTQSFTYNNSRAYNGWPWRGNTSVKSVSFAGPVKGQGSLNSIFYGLKNATSIDLQGFDTSNVTNMAGMFQNCSSLTKIDVSGLQTSKVTNMSYMFYGCSGLTNLDLSSFDTSAVTTMTSMFNGCSSLTSLDLSSFDTSNVTAMNAMLANCSKLVSLDISSFNTSKVTTMMNMFNGCSKLQSVKLSKDFRFDGKGGISNSYKAVLPTNGTGKWVRDDGKYGPYTPTELQSNYTSEMAGTWVITPSAYAVFDSSDGTLYFVKSYDSFYNGSTGTVHSISGGEYTGTIYTVSETSASRNWSSVASKVKKVKFVDEIKPTSTQQWFYQFSNCTEMDLRKLNTSQVTNMYSMFYGCLSLTTLDVSGFDTSNVTNMSQMFCGGTGKTYMALQALDVSHFDTSKVTDMTSMFWNCIHIETLDVSNWNTSNVTSMSSVFGGYGTPMALKSLDLSKWNTSKVTTMYCMFQRCANLTELDLSSFDTSNVTDMKNMFCNASGLINLDLSMFNTSQVTNMYSMFYGCLSLTTLDVSGFDTNKVTDMVGMFRGCSALPVLDLSSFDTSNVSNMNAMFGETTNLKEITLGSKFKFASNGLLLASPSPEYSGKWIIADESFGPFTPSELASKYNAEMAGLWVWDFAQFNVKFAAPEDAVGSMANVKAVPTSDYTLPTNKFSMFGYDFDHWDDGNGSTYADKAVIPAYRYSTGDTVTLTAVFKKRDTSFTMEDGAFEIKLRAGEKAVLPDIPSGTAYQIYELTPDGWVLVKQENASGVIQPLQESNAVFTNKYQPGVTTAQFSGIKTLDGNPVSADSYNFELKDADGNIIETTSNLEGGFIQFSVIQYDEPGTYEYTINEADPHDDSIDYDTHIEHIKVIVTDDGHGNLSSEVTYDSDGIVFNNKTRPGSLRITKQASGLTDANKDDTFAFKIRFYNANGTPVEDGQIYWYIDGQQADIASEDADEK